MLKGGKVYLSALGIAPALGYLVKWDKAAKSVIISTNDQAVTYSLNFNNDGTYVTYRDDFKLYPYINNEDAAFIRKCIYNRG